MQRTGGAALLLKRHPVFFRALFDQFFDARFSARDRFDAVAADIKFVVPQISRCWPEYLQSFEPIVLWRPDHSIYRAEFSVNDQTPQEGLWRLCLARQDGVRVYSLTFSVVHDKLVIGSMQGPPPVADALAVIRQATKDLHGLRPHVLLVDVARSVAHAWALKRLCGVDPSHQLKAAPDSSDTERVHFDYRGFWAELGGARAPDGYWSLPLVSVSKPLEAIESKKRAMYRATRDHAGRPATPNRPPVCA